MHKPKGRRELREVILRAGQSLHVRAVEPTDRERIRALFYRISPQSRYLRYQYVKEHITEAELDTHTAMDPPRSCTFVATTGEGGQEIAVAVASWFQNGPGSPTAEVAFLVEDAIQLRGIGTALLEHLAYEAVNYKQIKRFVATVLPENTRMLDVFMDSGFIVHRTLDEGTYSLEIDLKEQEEFSRRQAYREHIARSAGVRKLMEPRTVAVIGASRDAGSVGGAVFRNLIFGGFQGAAFPVNPNATSVAGVMAYPTVLDVPADVDLAVVVVPPAMVLRVIDQCGQKGVERAIIITAGFGEAGPEGKVLQQRVKEKALSYGMRILGPNCLGAINTNPEVRMNATFSPVSSPRPGNISISSHSGALGLALIDYAEKNHLGIRNFASIGNRVDLSSNDFLEYWEDDPETRVIAMYLESFGNPRKFSRIARRISRVKPVIAVKAGKSTSGAKAASSHTGALAASDVAVDAMFVKAGVIRVNTIQEMFNVVRLLANQPSPEGPRVGILTNAGGPGVLAADACEGWGLQVPPLAEHSQQVLREFLPKSAAVTNPVDMIASAPATAYGRALGVMLADPGVDAVVLIYIPPLVTRPAEVAREIRQALDTYEGGKPVLACFMMQEDSEVDLKTATGRTVPSYVFPEDAVQALARAWQYLERSRLPEGAVPRYEELDAEAIKQRAGARPSWPVAPGGWLVPDDAMGLMAEYGIPTAACRVARSADEAVAAAEAVGYPVAMKVRSVSIVHKTDVGGISLMLEDADAVRAAFERMQRKLAEAGLGAEADGVIIQPMALGGREVIVGMAEDPVFGPLVMLGLGGTEVEIHKDVAFALHPLTDLDPGRMVGELKARKALMEGWRGSPPVNMGALTDVLLRFSALVEDIPEIGQAEINPLLLYPKGKGPGGHDALVVDCRVMVGHTPTGKG